MQTEFDILNTPKKTISNVIQEQNIILDDKNSQEAKPIRIEIKAKIVKE